MSSKFVSLCSNGDLMGVKAALQNGANVNSWSDCVEDDWTGLMEAVYYHHNSVVAFLLSEPNIDVNWKSDWGNCALFVAVARKNNEALKLLLEVNVDVNLVDDCGRSVVHQAIICDNTEGLKQLVGVSSINVNILDRAHRSAVFWAVKEDRMEGLKLLLSHPNLTALTINHKDSQGNTPVMRAVIEGRSEHLRVLADDLRVDLDTTDEEGRSLEEVARWAFLEFIRFIRGPSYIT